MIVANFENNEVIFWDTINKKIVSALNTQDNDDKIIFVKYLEDDSLIIVKKSGKAELISTNLESQISFQRVSIDGNIVAAEMSRTRLFLVDNLGNLSVIDLRDGSILGTFTESDLGVNDCSGIVSINCHYEKDLLTIIFKNRVIRVAEFDCKSKRFTLKFKLQDSVNKWPWRLSGFSKHEEMDSLLIYGIAMIKGKQLIYLWDCVTGSLVQTLEGPKEEVASALWHPKKPQLITVGAYSGHIFIWGPDFPQKWAALVPNIEAIETNIEYIEREDEFDLPVEDEIKREIELDESVQIDFKDFITCSESANRDDRFLYYPIDSFNFGIN